jgi:hypothetical protein
MRAAAKRVCALILVTLCAALAADNTALAARLLIAIVEVDGKRVLETAYSDRGTERPATVWRYFGREPGWAKVAKIETDADNPLRARLQGKVVLGIMHVDRPIVAAAASEVELVRSDASSDRWYLPESEVERLADANDIAKVSPLLAAGQPLWQWAVAVGGLLVVLLLAVLCAWLMFRRPHAGVA